MTARANFRAASQAWYIPARWKARHQIVVRELFHLDAGETDQRQRADLAGLRFDRPQGRQAESGPQIVEIELRRGPARPLLHDRMAARAFTRAAGSPAACRNDRPPSTPSGWSGQRFSRVSRKSWTSSASIWARGTPRGGTQRWAII